MATKKPVVGIGRLLSQQTQKLHTADQIQCNSLMLAPISHVDDVYRLEYISSTWNIGTNLREFNHVRSYVM